MDRAHDLADGGQALVDLRQARFAEGGHAAVDHLLAENLGRRVFDDQLFDGIGDLEDFEDPSAAAKTVVRAVGAAAPALEGRSSTADRPVKGELLECRLVGDRTFLTNFADESLR